MITVTGLHDHNTLETCSEGKRMLRVNWSCIRRCHVGLLNVGRRVTSILLSGVNIYPGRRKLKIAQNFLEALSIAAKTFEWSNVR